MLAHALRPQSAGNPLPRGAGGDQLVVQSPGRSVVDVWACPDHLEGLTGQTTRALTRMEPGAEHHGGRPSCQSPSHATRHLTTRKRISRWLMSSNMTLRGFEAEHAPADPAASFGVPSRGWHSLNRFGVALSSAAGG